MLFKKPEPKVDTVQAGRLSPGTAFRRLDRKMQQYIYMVVACCGGVLVQSKDEREIIVVNLVTGTVFAIYAAEEVIPCVHATVVEDPRKV